MNSVLREDSVAALTLTLDDGIAESMGDGMYVLTQTHEGVANRVTLSCGDLIEMIGGWC